MLLLRTRITKLITGLYEDFDGEILINNISIKEYSQSQLKSLFSVVYQDFARYFVSFRDNIALGDINGCSINDINNALDTIDLTDAARNLPKGMDTYLGKIKKMVLIYQGVSGSALQWQEP